MHKFQGTRGTRGGEGTADFLTRFRREVCWREDDEDEEWRLRDDLEEEPGSRFLGRLRPNVVNVGTVEMSRMLIVLMSVTIECEWLDSLRLLPVVIDEELEELLRSNCWLEEGIGVAEEDEEEEEEGEEEEEEADEDKWFLRLR